ncbi:hypothetical protein Tco_0551206 [Tanacetum coccineum]
MARLYFEVQIADHSPDSRELVPKLCLKELVSHVNQHMDQHWLMTWLLQLELVNGSYLWTLEKRDKQKLKDVWMPKEGKMDISDISDDGLKQVDFGVSKILNWARHSNISVLRHVGFVLELW